MKMVFFYCFVRTNVSLGLFYDVSRGWGYKI